MRHDDPLIYGSQKTSCALVVLGRFGNGSGYLLRVSDLNLLFKMTHPSGTIPPPLSLHFQLLSCDHANNKSIMLGVCQALL